MILKTNLLTTFKKLLKPLERTIFHPQWLSYQDKEILIDWLKSSKMTDVVLDIGCADRWPEQYLAKNSKYIGLDYIETAIKRYSSNVDIYADAENLPFIDQSIDTVILFDVLEHINNGEKALIDIYRVLKPGGRVLIQIPFMYPIHDAPYDYRRLTKHGIEDLANRNDFVVESFGSRGKPLETAILLTNIALVKSLLNSLSKRALPAALFVPLVAIISTLLNCFGWVVYKIFASDDLMPFSYHFILKKK
jgi:SAM-dependent methyltransferase